MQFAKIRRSELNGKQSSFGLCGIGLKLLHAVEKLLKQQIPRFAHGVVGIYLSQGIVLLMTHPPKIVSIFRYVDRSEPSHIGIFPKGNAQDHGCASIVFIRLIQDLLALSFLRIE